MSALPWPAFEGEAPELAERGAELLRRFTLVYLATLHPGREPAPPSRHGYRRADGPLRLRRGDTVRPGDVMFRLDLTWALHKRRERGRGSVYLRWRARTA